MVFIKMNMVPPLKFHSKLNRMSRQHQSHCATCIIINFLIFFLKKSFLKIKNWLATPYALQRPYIQTAMDFPKKNIFWRHVSRSSSQGKCSCD
jgi:hypothetical protein